FQSDWRPLADFETTEAARLHPMRFRSPYSLRLEGTVAELAHATLAIASDDDEVVLVRMGRRDPGAQQYSAHAIGRASRDGKIVPLDDALPEVLEPEQRVVATIY